MAEINEVYRLYEEDGYIDVNVTSAAGTTIEFIISEPWNPASGLGPTGSLGDAGSVDLSTVANDKLYNADATLVKE